MFTHCLVCSSIHSCRGVIGPTRQFGAHALYKPELYALAVGAVLPIPFWYWQKRYPKTWLKYFSMPVLLNGPSYIPPALGINYSSWFVVAFLFRKSCLVAVLGSVFRKANEGLAWVIEYLIRKRNFRWWSKFNYILSSALDSGELRTHLNHNAFDAGQRTKAYSLRCRNNYRGHYHIPGAAITQGRPLIYRLVGQSRLLKQYVSAVLFL